jgi:hypothetical protein
MRTTIAGCLAAAALLVAGCGGGSGSSTATTNTTATTTSDTTSTASTGAAHGSSAPPGGTRVIGAKNGGFQTILPRGFTTRGGGEAAIEYAATRHYASGRDTNLTVFRATEIEGGLQAIVARALRNLAHQPAFLPKAHDVSQPRRLNVDAQPALYIDYRVAGRKPSERRQVFTVGSDFTYEISVSAAPARFPAALKALEEVIASWRW